MKRYLACIIFLSFFSLGLQAQEEGDTPFKKGLWLTNLEGTINSTNSSIDSSSGFNSAYGFEIASYKFFKDRWAAGLRLNASRSSVEGFVDRETESVFIGPSITHFLSESNYGSLYVQMAPGYVRFLESSTFNGGNTPVSQNVNGNGFGLNVSFGYSHALSKIVIFNFGMDITNFWIKAERSYVPARPDVEENIVIGSIAFNFGFSVLLEKFFF